MSNEQRLFRIFMDIHAGLPRQGPGLEECTKRALAMCADLPPAPTILDIGCGPGMQTLVLARNCGGNITAIDLHQDFLNELLARASEAGVLDHVTVQRADMSALLIDPQSIDLVWSEGAAYSIGVANALAAWRPFLKPHGYLAFTELVWLKPSPPLEVAEFFAQEYPAMQDAASNRSMIEQAGYTFVGHFTLPGEAWWHDYYTPLETKLPALKSRYEDDADGMALIAMTEKEIAMRRKYGDWYGYEFFVARVASAS